MPRKPEGDRALTIAERAARNRQRKADRDAAVVEGLTAALAAPTKRKAQEIVAGVLVLMKGRKNG